MSLRARLTLAFAVASFAVIGAIAVLVYVLTDAAAHREVAARLNHIASGLRDRLDVGMSERVQEIRVLALDVPRLSREAARLRSLLEQRQAAHPEFHWVGLTDAAGRVVAATRGLLEGEDVSQRAWWSNALGGVFVGDVREAPALQELLARDAGGPLRVVDIAFPVKDGDGEPAGVLGVHMGWDWAGMLANRVLVNAGAVGAVDLLVVRADGTVLLGPKPIEGQVLPPPVAGKARPDGYGEHRWPGGGEYVSAASATRGDRDYKGLGWQVVARQSRAAAFDSTDRLRNVLTMSAIVGVMAVSVLGYFLAGRLAAPLEQWAAAADRIGAGERDVRFPDAPGSSELGRLSAALRSMATRLQSKEDQLQARVEERTDALVEAMNALETERERLAYALEGSRLATWDLDMEKGTVTLSAEWARMLGNPPGETVTTPVKLLERVPEGEHAALREALLKVLRGEEAHYDVEHRVIRADATWLWIRSRGRVTRRSPAGRALRMNGTNSDVTLQKEAARSLKLAAQHLQQLTDGVDSLIAHFDLEARLLFANRRYREWFGIAEGAIPGIAVSEFVGDEAMQELLSHVPAIRRGESVSYDVVRTRGNVTREFEVRLEPQRGATAQVEGVYAVLNDVTARKTVERGLARQALTDAVTTLPNRRLLVDRVQVAATRARRSGEAFALLYLDLDGFKAVNDTLGHDAGDELLRRVGERLAACVRATDTVARVGGDEFALLLDPLADPADAAGIEAKIGAALQEPFALTDGEARISASIGVARCPGDGTDAAELLRAADAAMYRVKAAAKSRAPSPT